MTNLIKAAGAVIAVCLLAWLVWLAGYFLVWVVLPLIWWFFFTGIPGLITGILGSWLFWTWVVVIGGFRLAVWIGDKLLPANSTNLKQNYYSKGCKLVYWGFVSAFFGGFMLGLLLVLTEATGDEGIIAACLFSIVFGIGDIVIIAGIVLMIIGWVIP